MNLELNKVILEQELAYFYDLLDILHDGLPYDLDAERNKIGHYSTTCQDWIDTHLAGEGIHRGYQKYKLKLSVSALLTELLEVFPVALRNERPRDSYSIQKVSLVMMMIERIEDLYVFVKDYQEWPNLRKKPL